MSHYDCHETEDGIRACDEQVRLSGWALAGFVVIVLLAAVLS